MKTLAVLLLLLSGAVFLWQGPVVVNFFRKHVEVTTAAERADARRKAEDREIMARQEAEARAVENEIVRLAGEIDGTSLAKGSENTKSGPPAATTQAQNEKGGKGPAARGRRASGKAAPPQPM